LVELHLADNLLTQAPLCIVPPRFKNLKFVNLKGNYIETLPDEYTKITNVTFVFGPTLTKKYKLSDGKTIRPNAQLGSIELPSVK